MPADETNFMKQVDKFKTEPLLSGRTDIQVEPKGKNVISLPASMCTSQNPDVDDVNINEDGSCKFVVSAGTVNAICPLSLPDAATLTSVIVYGDDATNTWILYRVPHGLPLSPETIATAAIKSADTTITAPLVDNSSFTYHIVVGSMTTNDSVNGIKINYKFD